MDTQIEEIEKLVEKVKSGTATKEEKLVALKMINASLETFKVLLQESKNEA